MKIYRSINKWYVNKNGECSVLLSLTLDKKVVINTGIMVKKAEWDNNTRKIKGTNKNAKDNNLVISNCEARLNDIIVKYRLQNRQLTAKQLKKEYHGPGGYTDFVQFCEIENDKRKGLVSENTMKLHKSVIGKLQKFRGEIPFSDIGTDLINDFIKHLKNIGNNQNTIQKNLATLKVYILKGIRSKYLFENPFDIIKVKRTKPSMTFLNENELIELMSLYRGHQLPPNFQFVLRCFLFSCFTGLRISDIGRINYDDIKDDMLIFQPHKTRNQSKIVKIPIRGMAKELLNDSRPEITGRIFFPFADQVMNRILRKVIEATNIDKHISFHAARHTFATYFLKKTKNLAVLQKLLGHANITETMVYAHVLIEDIEKEMDCFNQLG